MVRLITHNLLACHAKGCNTNNFPLHFKDVKLELREADFNPQFLKGFMPKIEWKALVDTARELGDTSLPLEQPEMPDDDFLKNLHHVLLEVGRVLQSKGLCPKFPQIHVEEGSMTCPNCNHVYPISNGIPNMLLAEHEIG